MSDKQVTETKKKTKIVRHKSIPQDVDKAVDIRQNPTETVERWDARQVRYMQMLADPLNEMTQDEMAETVGVDRSTLWAWRNLPGFLETVDDLLMKVVTAELRMVYRGLMKEAKKGQVEQAKLILEQVGKRRTAGEEGTDKHLHLHKHFSAEKDEFGL